MALATIAAWRPVADRLFSGESVVLAAWLLGIAGYCASHLVRGAMSGMGKFGAYSRQLGGEAVARFIICVALALAGAAHVGPYALAVGAAPFLGLLVSLPGQRGLITDGPPAPWAEISASLGALLAGSILSMAVANLGPLFIRLLASPSEEAEAGRFLAALLVARIPLFLFQAVQSALLPKLASLVSEGRTSEFRRGFRLLIWFLSAAALVGIAGAFTVGSDVVRIMFGRDFALGSRTAGMLAIGAGGFMIASAIAQANIALGAQARQAWAWAAGVLTFLIVVGLERNGLYWRVELASAASSLAALAAQAVVLAGRLRGDASIDGANLFEAITDLSLEP
ncbi:MAG: hypothetical protein H0W70_03465 [Actinobacteria bacterium]|nr:hypothetical protein [Actinomycetota bacterium]